MPYPTAARWITWRCTAVLFRPRYKRAVERGDIAKFEDRDGGAKRPDRIDDAYDTAQAGQSRYLRPLGESCRTAL